MQRVQEPKKGAPSMKKINLSIILISTGIAAAMNPIAWSQHVKTWRETVYTDLSSSDKKIAESELNQSKRAVAFCAAMSKNDEKAVLEVKEAIRRTAMVTKKLMAPLLEELKGENAQNVQMKIVQAYELINNPEAKL